MSHANQRLLCNYSMSVHDIDCFEMCGGLAEEEEEKEEEEAMFIILTGRLGACRKWSHTSLAPHAAVV